MAAKMAVEKAVNHLPSLQPTRWPSKQSTSQQTQQPFIRPSSNPSAKNHPIILINCRVFSRVHHQQYSHLSDLLLIRFLFLVFSLLWDPLYNNYNHLLGNLPCPPECSTNWSAKWATDFSSSWITHRHSPKYTINALSYLLANTSTFNGSQSYATEWSIWAVHETNQTTTYFLNLLTVAATIRTALGAAQYPKRALESKAFKNQELVLVYSTSILVWWLIAPLLYSAAEIICPKGGYTALRTSLKMCFFGTPRPYSFLATPLVEHGQVADGGASASSSIGNALVTEEQRDSDCSIVISNISEELDVDDVQ